MSDDPNYAAALSAYPLAAPIEVVALPHPGNSTHNVGVRSGDRDFVLRMYTTAPNVDAIHYEHRLLRWLAAAGLSFAVPSPLATRSGDTQVATDRGWYALFPKLAGARLDWRDPAQVQAFGSALGELHRTLAQYSTSIRPGVAPIGTWWVAHPWVSEPVILTPDDDELGIAAADSPVLDWWNAERSELGTLVAGHYSRLPWQVIHNDFIPNNTLYLAGRVTAILDWEFTTPDVRVLDVAIGLRNMLRVWELAEPWEIVQRFSRGYQRWVRLTDQEIAAVPWLMRLRNVWLVARRLQRVSTGAVHTADLQRIEDAREFGQWLGAHQERLITILQTGGR